MNNLSGAVIDSRGSNAESIKKCSPAISLARGSADADGVPALSATIAHLLVSRSALHAWHAHPRLNPNYQQTESAEFDYGRAAHAVLLEGEDSRLCVIEADDWRTKAAKEARDAARAEGRIPLLARQMSKVRAMVKAATEYLAASEIAGILGAGDAEHALHWIEPNDNLPIHCRARLDWLSADRSIVLDYKTTANANPLAFVGMAVGYGYAMQEAFYRRAVAAVYGKTPRFVFLCQEKEAPYACSLVAFDPAMQDIGDRYVEQALSLWSSSMQSGRWHGYPSRIAYLETPAWYAARAAEIDFDNLDEAMNP